MKFKELDALIQTELDNLPDEGLTGYDAGPFAVQYLKMAHKIARAKMTYGTLETKYKGLLEAEYKVAHEDVEGRNADERKAKVEAEPKVLNAKERYASMKEKVDYLKVCLKIFDNAHVMCRQASREDA